jgi:hypothetical protein
MLIDNKIYVNKSLEPVMIKVVNEKHVKYMATKLANNKSYSIGKNGETVTKRNQIIDIKESNLSFYYKKAQYITDTFNLIYCNSSQDWFRKSGFEYGLEIVKLRTNDIRFIDTKDGQTIAMSKIKHDSVIAKQLENKYFGLKQILQRSTR